MTEENRRDWLTVAWATLGDLPADLLAEGCREARSKCDHPSKIVPMIVATTAERLAYRQRSAELAEKVAYVALPPPPRHVLDRRGEPMTQADTDELNRILATLGPGTARYRTDGTRYFTERTTQ